jgi:hypothetical protein
MTVTINDRRLEYPGNGVALVFPGPRLTEADQLDVYLVDAATRVVTDQVYATDYSVTGVGLSASTVTFVVPPPSGQTVLLLRTVPNTQLTRFANQGSFFPELHEDAFDLAAMRDQQMQDVVDRTLRLADTIVGFSSVLETIEPLAPVVINAAGTGIEPGSTTLTGDMLLRPNLADASDPAKGAALLGFTANGTGAEARTVRDKIGERFSVLDFIPKAQHAAIAAKTSTFDATADIQQAIDYVGSLGGGEIQFPAGLYNISATLILKAQVFLVGAGGGNYVSGTPNVRLSAATRIAWLAAAPAAGTPMVDCKCPALGKSQGNGGLRHLMLDGAALCPVGLKLTSWIHGKFDSVTVFAATTDCFLLDVARYALDASNTGITYLNEFRNCFAITFGGSGWYLDNTARGFHFVGSPPENPGDSSENTFINCGAFLAYGVAFYLESCGQNIFISCYGGALNPAVPAPYYNVHLCSADQNSANPGSLTGASRYHIFLWTEMKFLVRASQVSGGSSSFGCMLYGLSEGNVNTDPVTIESPGAGALPPTVSYTTSGTKTDPALGRFGQVLAAMWDDTNAVGPAYLLRRNAAVGVNGMGLGYIQWQMTNNAGTRNVNAGLFQGVISSAAAGAESVTLNLLTMVTGASASAMQWKDGVIVPASGGGLLFKGYGSMNINDAYYVDNTQVVKNRMPGWALATGTATRTTFVTSTVTLPQLAEHVKALIDDLHATAGHGLLGT